MLLCFQLCLSFLQLVNSTVSLLLLLRHTLVRGSGITQLLLLTLLSDSDAIGLSQCRHLLPSHNVRRLHTLRHCLLKGNNLCLCGSHLLFGLLDLWITRVQNLYDR